MFSSSSQPEYWFRYEDSVRAAPVDEFDNPIGRSRVEIVLFSFRVLKHTPKGVWLGGVEGGTNHGRLVLKNSHKRFACPTIEEAKASFITRKKKQQRIYTARLEQIVEALRMIENRDDFRPVKIPAFVEELSL